jgi:hypothetical protein
VTAALLVMAAAVAERLTASQLWQERVREIVEQAERGGKRIRGDAVNADGWEGGGPAPAVTANGDPTCSSPLYPDR